MPVVNINVSHTFRAKRHSSCVSLRNAKCRPTHRLLITNSLGTQSSERHALCWRKTKVSAYNAAAAFSFAFPYGKAVTKSPEEIKKNRAQSEREVVLLLLQECKMLNVVHMAVYSWFHIFRTTPTAHHCWQKILPLCVCVCFLRMRKSLGHPHTHTLTRWSPILFFCSARSFLHWTFGCTKTNFFPAASL